eukprot:scaffold38790_cov74-Phaeocystis_antarctica.AAC.5
MKFPKCASCELAPRCVTVAESRCSRVQQHLAHDLRRLLMPKRGSISSRTLTATAGGALSSGRGRSPGPRCSSASTRSERWSRTSTPTASPKE